MIPDQSGDSQLNYVDCLQEEMAMTMNINNTNKQQQINLKTSSSYNVILQSDLFVKVFNPLEEDPVILFYFTRKLIKLKDFDKEFLVTVILEYLRVLTGIKKYLQILTLL